MPNADRRRLTRKSFKSPPPALGLLVRSGPVWHGQWSTTRHTIRCNAIAGLSTWDYCGLFGGKQKCFVRHFYGFPCRQLRNELRQQAKSIWNGKSAVNRFHSPLYDAGDLRMTNLCYLKWNGRERKKYFSQIDIIFLQNNVTVSIEWYHTYSLS